MKNILLALLCLALFACSNAQSDYFKNDQALRYHQLGQEFTQTAKFDSALYYFNLSDKISPNNPFNLHERGLLKVIMKDLKGGFEDLSKSIELCKETKQKLIFIENRGLTYLEVNDLKHACQDFRIVNSGNCLSYIKQYCK